MQSVRIFFNPKKRSYTTSSHPQWREATSLLRVRELIQPSRNSEEAHPRSHWRKGHTIAQNVITQVQNLVVSESIYEEETHLRIHTAQLAVYNNCPF